MRDDKSFDDTYFLTTTFILAIVEQLEDESQLKFVQKRLISAFSLNIFVHVLVSVR